MMRKGRVVRSIAGRDKDRFYVIVEARGDRVAIADGKVRKLGKPKSKNVLHVRPTNAILDMEVVTTDRKLREALKRFGAGAEPGCSEEGGN